MKEASQATLNVQVTSVPLGTSWSQSVMEKNSHTQYCIIIPAASVKHQCQVPGNNDRGGTNAQS